MSEINLGMRIALRKGESLNRWIAVQILRRADLRRELGLAPLKYGIRPTLDEQNIRATDVREQQRTGSDATIRSFVAQRGTLQPKIVTLRDVLRTASTPEALRLLGEPAVKKPKLHDSLEEGTQTASDQLFDAMIADRKANPPSALDKVFNNLLTSVMNNPAMQKAAFFFIEVFAVLKKPEDIVDHLKAYFKDVEMPALFKAGVSLAGVSTHASVAAIRSGIKHIARRFVVAETVEEAVDKFVELHQRGISVTADLLGERTLSIEEARASTAKYVALIEKMADRFTSEKKIAGLEPEISVKLSSISHIFEAIDQEGTYEAVRENLNLIFRTARARGIRVTIDMESYKVKDLTLTVVKQVLEQEEFNGWEGAGIVIQTYLKDAEKDIHETIAWAKARGTRISIRLVKGAYYDLENMWARQEQRESPVFERKCETDANFERCAGILLENHRYVRPAIATMNVRSATKAMVLAKYYNVSQADWELQLLYGMNDHLAKAELAVSESILGYKVRVRLYGPIGNLLDGMAYMVRRLIENTSQTGFLRQAFLEEKDRAGLLEDPFAQMAVEDQAPLPDHEATHDSISRPIFRRTPPLEWFKADIRKAFVKTVKQVNMAPVPSASKETARQAVEKAVALQKDWENLGGAERAKRLHRAAEIMLSRRMELAAIMCFEVGKNPREADADVCEAIDFLNYYADQAEYFGDSEALPNFPGEIERTKFVARGVTLTVGPWNFPLAIPTGMSSSNSAGGNSVVWKPSSKSPIIGREMANIFNAAGIPIQYVPSGREVGDVLVAHPDVNTIVFTGSEEVGKRILEVAGKAAAGQKAPKKVAAEMGGKNGIIVDADADMDEAIAGIIYSAFGYQGQKCSACSRVIFVGDDEQYEVFIRRLVQAANSFKIGPAHELGTFMGPVIDQKAREDIQGFFDRAIKAGARVLLDRKIDLPLPQEGAFMGPKIVDNVALDAELAQEEVFGPVLAVFKAKNFDHALEIANDPRFGLTGAVYSRHPKHIEKAIQTFRVGNLYINRGSTGALVAFQPFGAPGDNWSGTGAAAKPGGWGQILEYVGATTVSANVVRSGFAAQD